PSFMCLRGSRGVHAAVGHGGGARLLAQAARGLRGTVPSQHTVARWGGDEFAVLVESAASAPEIVEMAERLVGVIASEPFHVADRELPLTASIGVAFADRAAPGHLPRNADLALAPAKASSGGGGGVVSARLHAHAGRRR